MRCLDIFHTANTSKGAYVKTNLCTTHLYVFNNKYNVPVSTAASAASCLNTVTLALCLPLATGHIKLGFLRLLSVVAQKLSVSKIPHCTVCFFFSPKKQYKFPPKSTFSTINKIPPDRSSPNKEFSSTSQCLYLLHDPALHLLSPCFGQLKKNEWA